jgi:hypothetical protein
MGGVNMFLSLRCVVTAFFVRPDLISAAKIGRSNPWADAQQRALSAPFTNFGLKSPFGTNELDPLFIIEVGERPLGYSRVFETKRLALNWLVTLVEKRDVYSYWHLGAPVGPFGAPEEYKSADQFVDRIAVHSERAFTARGAAEAALKRFQRHFDEPLYYWDRTARGTGILDEIKEAIATPGWK